MLFRSSFNVHMSEPNFGKLTSLHFHAWRLGLKTGMYYLRTRAAADAIKFTVSPFYLSAAPFYTFSVWDNVQATVLLTHHLRLQCRIVLKVSAVFFVWVWCAIITVASLYQLHVTKCWLLQVDQQALSKSKLRTSLNKENGSGSSTPRGIKSRLSLNRASLPPKSATHPFGELTLNVGPSSPVDIDVENEKKMAAMICSLDNRDACLSCGS